LEIFCLLCIIAIRNWFFAIHQWVWPNFSDFFAKLSGVFSELSAHCRRNIHHLKTLFLKSDFFEQAVNLCYSSFCVEITFQVMTVAFQSTGDHYTVSAILESSQNIQGIQLAGTGQFDDFDGRRIFQPHRTSQVCGSISTVVAAKGDDIGSVLVGHSE